ncbi:39S ribosomal protein L44, mitochondrial [Amphibalanus amphitrite]|uniref:Large ribosomal subunit protein mL44 n=1 Tax=Amphibalanus amphitrite TaxID=1232801 RepID=A0A6A4VBG5_AMPAM|nr:39S ribosomal protein L44, mitochondrial [Amphibalanus amphitrite]
MAAPYIQIGFCGRSIVKLCNASSTVFVARRTFLPKHVRPTLSAIAARKKKQKPAPPEPRSSYIEWNYPAELFAFSARLGESVDEPLLRRALTERSHMLQSQAERRRLGLPENEADSASNTELAERGSDIMTSYISGWLRSALPLLPEEGVQSVTSYLTSQQELNQLASGIGLKDIVLSEEYPPSEETMARCLRAFVAALAESSGEERAQLFVRDFVLARLATVDLTAVWQIEELLSVLSCRAVCSAQMSRCLRCLMCLIRCLFCLTCCLFCLTYRLFCLTYCLFCLTYRLFCLTYRLFCLTYRLFCLTYRLFCLTYRLFCAHESLSVLSDVLYLLSEPLSVLSDVLRRCGREPPEPRLLRSAGPGSLLAAYVVGVYSDRKLMGYAPGDSVSEATELAARAALNQLMGVSERSAPLDIRAERTLRHAPAAALAEWRPL